MQCTYLMKFYLGLSALIAPPIMMLMVITSLVVKMVAHVTICTLGPSQLLRAQRVAVEEAAAAAVIMTMNLVMLVHCWNADAYVVSPAVFGHALSRHRGVAMGRESPNSSS